MLLIVDNGSSAKRYLINELIDISLMNSFIWTQNYLLFLIYLDYRISNEFLSCEICDDIMIIVVARPISDQYPESEMVRKIG